MAAKTQNVEHEVRTLARFAAEVYLLADELLPSHLNWRVELYDDALHATPSPVVELRVTMGRRGRKIVWMPGLVVHDVYRSEWPRIIREGIEGVRHEFSV